jgi:hypothetical protein
MFLWWYFPVDIKGSIDGEYFLEKYQANKL